MERESAFLTNPNKGFSGNPKLNYIDHRKGEFTKNKIDKPVIYNTQNVYT